MVRTICDKTGIPFEAKSTRQINHPEVSALLNQAARNGTYTTALKVFAACKQEGMTDIDAVITRACSAMEAAYQEQVEAKAQRKQEQRDSERQRQDARRDREWTNSILRDNGYKWFDLGFKDEEDADFTNFNAVTYGRDWHLYYGDREVSVKQAMLELAWKGDRRAKNWLVEHGIAEEMPEIEKHRQDGEQSPTQEEEEQFTEEQLSYQQEAMQALQEAGLSEEAARKQAIFWSKPHNASNDELIIAPSVELHDGRLAFPAINGEFRYGILMNNEWTGIDELLAEEELLPPSFRRQLMIYGERNKRVHG
ncbi:hypothetical protein KSF_109910 [Reticulibacter mediterranei]|uniref:Uncharacterized protein n=1 Tax=Reticulibacter mediterranei TaxID=2778369 RepID=A0A8J3N9M0_9CHLR|nr:hypothetical protein [Reticulibacter mediterranei]GHP00944.1 hypothetical protein KSF_109910 [Reticulibacter mediterranei]